MEIISKEELLEQVAGGGANRERVECEQKVLDTFLSCIRFAQNTYEGIERGEAMSRCAFQRESDLARCRAQ